MLNWLLINMLHSFLVKTVMMLVVVTVAVMLQLLVVVMASASQVLSVVVVSRGTRHSHQGCQDCCKLHYCYIQNKLSNI